MKTRFRHMAVKVGVILLASSGVSFIAWGQEPSTTTPPQATFPPSTSCTTATPCRNVTGEVVRSKNPIGFNFPMGNRPTFV